MIYFYVAITVLIEFEVESDKFKYFFSKISDLKFQDIVCSNFGVNLRHQPVPIFFQSTE